MVKKTAKPAPKKAAARKTSPKAKDAKADFDGPKSPRVVDQGLGQSLFFVDGYSGIATTENTIKINFVQDFTYAGKPLEDYPDETVFRRVCLRMVMDKTAFLSIADNMKILADSMREPKKDDDTK